MNILDDDEVRNSLGGSKKTKIICVRLPRYMVEVIDYIKKKRGFMSRSEFVRTALTYYMHDGPTMNDEKVWISLLKGDTRMVSVRLPVKKVIELKVFMKKNRNKVRNRSTLIKHALACYISIYYPEVLTEITQQLET